METAWNSFLSVYIIAIASSNNIFLNKSGGGGQGVTHKQGQMGENGQKLNFQANGRRWRNNGVGTAWNSFLSVYKGLLKKKVYNDLDHVEKCGFLHGVQHVLNNISEVFLDIAKF